jgi:3-hydroxyacyl-CoA dehydrogenase
VGKETRLQPFTKTRLRTDKLGDPAAREAVYARAEAQVASGRPELIAPRKILEAVRTGVETSFEAGLLCEQDVFRQCMASLATQNKIHVFCASRQTAHSPTLQSVRPAEITEAGVLGMGTMGAGIAQALVASGVRTTVCDERASALQAGAERIRTSLDRRVAQGKLSTAKAEATLARLTTTDDCRALAGAQLVVEAVFEEIEVKRSAIARLEAVCPAETIIATNTSTINLDVLAQGMRHPDRLVGLHFFHPAQAMPLVEVVRRRATPAHVAATAFGLAKAIGKTPILVANREGFVVNRLFIPYLMEAFWLLEEGARPAEIDRAMVDFGMAMGPLQLIDMSGLDILVKTHAIMRQAFPHFGDLSPIVSGLVDAGHLGQKTGAGVYRYEGKKVSGTVFSGGSEKRLLTPLSPERIVSRLMLRMVVEALGLLEEGVTERPTDVDVAMVLGTGLADFRGGVLKYAHDLGMDRVRDEIRRLHDECGPRYRIL